MNSLLHDHATGILDNAESPWISLYQPTHRTHPDNQQDQIRFRNLLKNGGQVVIVPKEQMPTQAGVAAIFRF